MEPVSCRIHGQEEKSKLAVLYPLIMILDITEHAVNQAGFPDFDFWLVRRYTSPPLEYIELATIAYRERAMEVPPLKPPEDAPYLQSLPGKTTVAFRRS